MPDDTERSPIPDPEAERIAEVLSSALGEEFAGYPCRVDAGEHGRVWVALAEAEEDRDARRVTSERVDREMSEMGLSEGGVRHRIAAAASEGDLVLVCELFTRE